MVFVVFLCTRVAIQLEIVPTSYLSHRDCLDNKAVNHFSNQRGSFLFFLSFFFFSYAKRKNNRRRDAFEHICPQREISVL